MNCSTLSIKVFGGYGAKFVFVELPLLLGLHPLNAVQTFLENVAGSRLKVALFPQTQAITRFSVALAIVATQGRNLCAVLDSFDRMNQIRILTPTIGAYGAFLCRR